MFKIAVQTGGPEDFFGLDEAYRMIAEAGFDGVDANIDHLFPVKQLAEGDVAPCFRPETSEKEMIQYFRPWKDAAEKYHLDNYQAHAPFPSTANGLNSPEYNAFLIEMLKKTIIGCASIDCHNLVIHAFHCDRHYKMPDEEFWQKNVESYAALAETAKREGVTVCVENLMSSNGTGNRLAGPFNRPDQAVRIVDTLNEIAGSRVFAFCLDIGHANMARNDPYEFITALGDRLQVLHVHDNDGTTDNHVAPYWGTINWDRFIEGLAAVHFNKTLSFETFRACLKTDKALCGDVLKFVERCGRLFDRKASAIAGVSER